MRRRSEITEFYFYWTLSINNRNFWNKQQFLVEKTALPSREKKRKINYELVLNAYNIKHAMNVILYTILSFELCEGTPWQNMESLVTN